MTDLFSKQAGEIPNEDEQNNFVPIHVEKLDDGRGNFTVSRLLNTGDDDEDMVMECGQEYTFTLAGHNSSSEFKIHNRMKQFLANFTSSCDLQISFGEHGMYLMAGLSTAISTFLY